jgi:hypothetical protein
VPGDVFKENPAGFDFADDPGNIWPQVTLVAGAPSLPGCAERLARVACENGVECAAEGAGVERGKIVPYGRGGEVSGALGGDEDGAGPLLPLDEAPGVESGFCEHEAHIQSSAACAEGQSVPGT